MSWDTSVRTSTVRASFQSPREAGFKADGIDHGERLVQRAPTEIMAKKQQRWDADVGYGGSLAPPSYDDTRLMHKHAMPPPVEQCMRGYVPPPAIPGRRNSAFGNDWAAAMKANPEIPLWGRSLAAGPAEWGRPVGTRR